jgi:hypothetical protein
MVASLAAELGVWRSRGHQMAERRFPTARR